MPVCVCQCRKYKYNSVFESGRRAGSRLSVNMRGGREADEERMTGDKKGNLGICA